MAKFTCVVLCAVSMNLNRIYAGEVGLGDINTILLDCAKENDVTNDQMHAVVKSQDVANVNPCFFACLLKRARFLNDKGEYDVNTGLTYVRQVLLNRPEIGMVENIVKQCESVKDITVHDGEAGCERGALVAACFMKQIKSLKPKYK